MATIKFPGLLDVHVHLREPGAAHKEDFLSGSRAALAGGFTYILDMPNNPLPTISLERLEEKISLSKQKSVCDIGFYYGTDGNNIGSFAAVAQNPYVFGLKIYCNHTTGTLLIEDKDKLNTIFNAWNFNKPILVHAERDQLEFALFLAEKFKRKLHVCHISLASEVEMVKEAKWKKTQVSTGVTPHHLFLTQKDVEKLKNLAIMKPPLGTQADQNALWDGLLDGTIDLVESDHAPHTFSEKQKNPPVFCVPGLETTLGLLLLAVHEKRITIEQVKRLLYDQPKAIFNIPEQKNTYTPRQ